MSLELSFLFFYRPEVYDILIFPDWYSAKLPDFNAWLTTEVSRTGLKSLSVIPPFVVTSAMLEPDGIHLNPASGDLFLNHLCQSIQTTVSSSELTLVEEEVEVVSSSESDDEDMEAASVGNSDRLGAILKIVKSNSKRLRSVKPLRDTLAKLDERTTTFEMQVRL